MKEKTIFGRLFAILMFAIYFADTCNTVHTIVFSINPDIYGFDGIFTRLFDTFPWWYLLCSLCIMVSGLMAPILYWSDSPRAGGCAAFTFGCLSLLLILRFAFQYRLATLTWRAWILAASVALLTLLFAVYLNACRDKNVISEHNRQRFLGSD